MLLCFVVKKQLFNTRTPPPRHHPQPPYQPKTTLLKHPSLQSWHSSKWQ